MNQHTREILAQARDIINQGEEKQADLDMEVLMSKSTTELLTLIQMATEAIGYKLSNEG